MATAKIPSEDEQADPNRIPLRRKPNGRMAQQRLARIAKNCGIDAIQAFDVTRKHWAALGVLTFCCLGALIYGGAAYKSSENSAVAITVSAPGHLPVKIEIRQGDAWQEIGLKGFENRSDVFQQGTPYEEQVSVPRNSIYRLSIFNEGQEIRTEPGEISQNLRIVFDARNEARPCMENFPETGLTIVRCPEAEAENLNIPSWRETLGDSAPEGRLQSIGIGVYAAGTDKQEFRSVEENLLRTRSVDVLYRIYPNADGQLDIREGIRKIETDLGAWARETQVLMWPDYVDQKGLTAEDFQKFGRVLAFGTIGDFKWIRSFDKLFDSKKGISVSEKALVNALPSKLVKGKGQPFVFGNRFFYYLRNKPITVSDKDSIKKFKLDENWRPLKYVDNDFTDNGDGTITDRATGLMWQQSGSDWGNYEKAEAYIRELNQKRFAGHDDWRLPTVDELTSLLEPEKQSEGLYINPIFNKEPSWRWTADKRASGGAWDVDFIHGDVGWNLSSDLYVRAVRP